jgi:tetraacyldisaccharide 4'-kinase
MILKPFEYIYHALSSTKNLLYEKKWLPTVQMNRPLISIGNLSFGGTGKTPFTLFLVNELSEYKKIVLISKSYKARLKTPQAVNLKLKNAAEVFGDEAVLLQSKLPQVKVWAGPHKYQTALASQVDKPDLIILSHVLEHVANPIATLKELFSYSNTIYIEVPYGVPKISKKRNSKI